MIVATSCLLWLLSVGEVSGRRSFVQPATAPVTSRQQPNGRLRNDFKDPLAAALGLRGGGPQGESTNSGARGSNGDGEAGGMFENVMKKTMLALGAFAVQQTLTKMADSGQLSLPQKQQQPKQRTLMVQDAPSSKRGLLEAAPKKEPEGDASTGATIPEHVL